MHADPSQPCEECLKDNHRSEIPRQHAQLISSIKVAVTVAHKAPDQQRRQILTATMAVLTANLIMLLSLGAPDDYVRELAQICLDKVNADEHLDRLMGRVNDGYRLLQGLSS